MITNPDKAIITLVSQDIPLAKEPFKELALKLGVDERILLERLRAMKKSGRMRKFTAFLNHRKIGFKHNAMAVWDFSDKSVERWGNFIAAFAQVSHCYQRKRAADWNYNLYAMIHGRSKAECLKTVRVISKKTCCKDYKVLFSGREYKKSAARF